MASVEVRTYKARSQADAAVEFGDDAADMADAGYVPSQQMWSAPRYWPVLVVPLVLLVLGYLIAGWAGVAIAGIVGIVIIARGAPKGELTVTYTKR